MKTKDRSVKSSAEAGMYMKIKHLAAQSGNVDENTVLTRQNLATKSQTQNPSPLNLTPDSRVTSRTLGEMVSGHLSINACGL